MATQPKLIDVPFATNDNAIHDFPLENTDATVVTQKDGWRQDPYSRPLEAGGKAPERVDFNSMFNWITKHLFFTQKGWLWGYDANQDYYTPAMVWESGTLWFCKADVEVGNTYHRPSTDVTEAYWTPFFKYIRNLAVGNGKLSLKYDNKVIGEFTANQTEDKTITVPTANNGKLTIKYNDSVVGTFYANQTENVEINLQGDVIPTGTVQAWAGDTNRASIPAGWLLCDGRELDTTAYPNLFNVIGYKYGGSGTKFKIPDLNNRFIEGTTTNSGSYIEAGLPNITGELSRTGGGESIPAWFSGSGCITAYMWGGWHRDHGGSTATEFSGFSFDASRSSPIYGKSTTVQPQAIYMRYLIKF